MTTIEFLAHLRSLHIQLWVEGSRLRYNAPPGALSPQLRDELVTRKAEILTLLGSLHPTTSATPPIRPAPPETTLLSFSQERAWFIHQLDPDNPAYNIPGGIRLIGGLNLEALERSLLEIVRRHAILRTTFATVDGQPIQFVAPPAQAFHLPIVDLRHVPAAGREAETQRQIREEAARPFDLLTGPLIRAMLVRLSDGEHVLLVTMHHIISDQWSFGVFLRELAIFYEFLNQQPDQAALADGLAQRLPPLPIQYIDYAAWQRQWLAPGADGDVLAQQMAYWKRQLGSAGTPAPTTLDLPTDYPRQATQTFAGSRLTFTLPTALVADLKRFSQHEKATLFMTLLAAFQTLLYRYTGQHDIVVGSSIANRNQRAIEGLIGFFVNTLVLRTDLSGNPSFRALVGRVRAMTMDAYAHQELPFEKLVEELRPERDLSRHPLFQVLFELHATPTLHLQPPGLEIQPIEIERTAAQFDLTLSMADRAEGLSGYVEYNTQLFERATIERLLGHFQMMLMSVVADPDQRVAALPLLTECECKQLLDDWNATQAAYPLDQCFHRLFESQVALTPDLIAVSCEQERLSYQQLNQRANRVARRLRAFGVGPDVVVGLLADRGIDLLTMILAIFKAGGAYLPLDPRHPNQRYIQVLSQSQSPLVLVAADRMTGLLHALEQLPPAQRPQVLEIEDPALQQADAANLTPLSTPAQLAYVIYTSGSTGLPKGAMLEQRGMINHLYAKITTLGLTQADCVAQTASQCFDISVWQFLAALLVGGQVRIVPDEIAFDPRRLMAHVAEHQVTILETVPSLLRSMLTELAEQDQPTRSALRWMIPTGEALPPDVAREWLRVYPAIPLLNAYGPTECSDDVTHYRIDHPLTADMLTIPIGRPIANTRLYILDRRMQLLPVGIPGELYVGGVGVGRGYLNDPARTAQVFVPDCFASEPGQRLYRTGDLARYQPDGNILFGGRIDHQVKLRGFRIELGEIEAVMARHPAVREAVVIVREDQPPAGGQPDKRLVAYVVEEHDKEPGSQTGPDDFPSGRLDSSDFRSFLKDSLPEYMVPSAIVVLDALPLTPNGKLDRRALPQPMTNRSAHDRAVVAPRTPIEELLVAIWQQVLSVDQFSIHDNFFALGGHSLLITRVNTRLRESLGVDLPLRTLFEQPTVAALAAHIANIRREADARDVPTIQPIARDKPVPLSFAQLALWKHDRRLPGNPAYNEILAARLSGVFDLAALERSLHALAQRHEHLRTTFPTIAGVPVQHILSEAAIPVIVVDLQHLAETEWTRAAEARAASTVMQPFDLSAGPLLRAEVLRFSPTAHALLLPYHRIMLDRWSTAIFLRELLALYEEQITGKAAPLAALPIQYADYAAWQHQWLATSSAATEQLHYWKRQLAAAPRTPILPPDHPAPSARSYRGQRLALPFPNAQIEALRALSYREGVTLFMSLVTAFNAALLRLTGQTDLLLGVGVANRTQTAVEPLIGSFANTIVLRSDLSGDRSFRDLLRQIRATTLDAYTNQEFPFERLVEALQAEDQESDPLFQVMVVFQNMPAVELRAPGLDFEPLVFPRETTRYDLILSIQDTGAEVVGSIGYNIDLFDALTIERLADAFRCALEALLADSGLSIRSNHAESARPSS
jgi:amino acid adenylation domain-containing protein